MLHVVGTWLADADNDKALLRALSRLDVACTNHRIRGMFLALASSPFLPWPENHEGFQGQHSTYLTWLLTREVKAKSLSLLGDDAVPELCAHEAELKFVTDLSLDWMKDSNIVKRIFQVCPNVCATAICGDLSGGIGGCEIQTLPHSETRRLTLVSCYHSDDYLPLLSPLCPMPYLEELCLMGTLNTALFIPQDSQFLQKLFLGFALTWEWKAFIVTCVHLMDLTIGLCDPNDVRIVHSAISTSLKRFAVGMCKVNNGQVFSLFTELLEYTGLEYLAIEAFCYCRRTCNLKIDGTDLTLTDFESILNCCPGVITVYGWELDHLKPSSGEMLANYNRCLIMLTWLLSREIKMRSLDLIGNSALSALPDHIPRMEQVTHLTLHGVTDSGYVSQLFLACPNTTSFRSDDFCWTTLPIGIRRLSLDTLTSHQIHDTKLVLLVRAMPHLEDLRLTGATVTCAVLADELQVRKLELGFGLTWPWKAIIVRSGHLSDLVLGECVSNDVELIHIALMGTLKRFTVRKVVNAETVPSLFIQILNSDALEYLSLGLLCHSRQARRLEVRGAHLTLTEFDSIVSSCPGLITLDMREFYQFNATGGEMLAKYNRCLAMLSGLLNLTLAYTAVSLLCDLLSVCPLIQRIELEGGIGDMHIRQIATCKRLQSLKIVSAIAASVSEDAMMDVIVGCPKLAELHIQRVRVSNRLLDVIAENRLRLVKFNYGAVAFTAGDVSAFVEQVKKYHLPVTVMIKLW